MRAFHELKGDYGGVNITCFASRSQRHRDKIETSVYLEYHHTAVVFDIDGQGGSGIDAWNDTDSHDSHGAKFATGTTIVHLPDACAPEVGFWLAVVVLGEETVRVVDVIEIGSAASFKLMPKSNVQVAT